MLTGRLAVERRAAGGRRRGRRRRARPGPRSPIRSQWACTARAPGLEGPGLGLLAAAGGRGLEHAPVVEDPAGRGRRRAPARSPSAPGPSPGSPRSSASKPPTSSTSERRRTLRWQVYICVRSRSGRPVRLEEGPRVAAGPVDLVLVGVDVVGLRVGLGSPRRPGPARRGGACRRGRAGRRTRLAPSPGRRWRPRRCRRCRCPAQQADARISALRGFEHRARRAARLEASSTRHSSQSPKLCRRTERSIARSTSAGVS